MTHQYLNCPVLDYQVRTEHCPQGCSRTEQNECEAYQSWLAGQRGIVDEKRL